MAVRYNPVKGPSLPGSDLKEKKVNEREKARAQSYQSGKAPAKPKNTGKGRGAVKTASSSASFSPVQGTTQHLDRIRKRTTGGQTVKQTFVPDSGARFVPQGKVNPVKGAESPLDRMRARTESSAQDDSERIGKALRKEYDAATPTGRKVLEKHGVLGPDEFSQIMAVNRVFRPGKSNGVTSKKTKYQMAIEGQFGDLTTPELHKRIRENEKKIASLGGAVVPNSVMAQGLERQNRALMQIILDRDKEERERRHRTELNELQRRKTDPDFYEKAKPTHSWMQTGDSDYIFINGHAGVGLDYSSGKLYETTRERTLATMTRDEIALYNYLYNVDGRASAKRYLELIEPALNRRRAENDARETVRFSDEHPVLATIDTWLNAPARGASGALAVADDILKIEKGEIVDVNSQWHALGNETKLARKTVSDKIEKAVDWEIPIVGNVASFAYNTANSIMDSVVLAATGSAFAPVGTPEMTKRFVSAFVTLAMSSDSAAGTIVANKEKGYSDIRAVGLGLTTGLIEAMTEKMAIDEIMKAPKSALKSLGIGFLSEGTEEVASGVANMAVDRMVNGTDSEISQLIAAYMSKGYDKYSATARALADSLVPDFLAGGLSGMAMSGVFDAAGLKSNETSDGEQTKNPAAETQQDSGKVTFEDVVFMTGDKKESPKYDYTKSFSQQVDDFIAGKIPEKDSLLIGGTGDVYQQIGLNPLPMAIDQTHVDYVVNGTKDADHYLGKVFLKQLPDAIQNPVAIIASESRPTESIVALLPFVHNGKTVIAPVEIDGSARFNNIRFDVNAISSVYAKGNMSASTMQRTNDAMKKLHDAIQKDTKGDVRLYYWNKNEALALLQRAGLQLPGGLPKGGFIHSVRENGSKVKPKFENVTETQQFQRWFRNEGVKGVPPSKVVDADGNPEVMFYQGINAAASGDYFYAFSRNEATSKRLPGVSRKYAVNSAYLNIAKPMKRTVTEKQYQDMQYMGSLIGTAKHSGKDGLILDIQKDGKIADTIFVVFDEKQMKATNNVGTFFPDSDNPRYSVGTKLDEKYESPENAVVLSEARGVFEKLGFTVTTEAHISDMPENVDGYVDFTNKEVYINPKAENPQEVVIKHELIHILERSSGSRYVVAVKEAIMAKMPKQWEKKYQENWAKYEKLSKSKPELAPTEKRITSETIADFAMYFSKDDVIRHYAQNPENRTFMQVVKDFFAYIRLQAKVLFKEGREAVFWNSCARKWEKALTKAMNDGGNVHVSGNDARSMLFDVPDGTVLTATEQAYYEKIIENYRNELSKYKQGKFPERGYYVLGRPVPILRKYLKSNDEMILPTDVIVKATGGKHNISVDELVNLAEKMIDPLMILESDTVKNGYVIFLEMVDKNNVPVFATVHTRRMEGRLHVTRIASLYSKYDYESFRDKTQNFINEQVKKGRFKYANKKSQSWFSTFGLQLPSVVQTFIDSNTSLSQDKPGVNSYSMQKTEKDADDVSLMVSDSGDTAASETTVEDLQMELEEIDSRLENDELTEEEERKLERRSRSLQRKIMIALAKESSAKKQPIPEEAETESNARSSYHTEKLRDAVETYHTTGDTSGIPTKKSVNASQKRYNRKLEEIDAELDAVTKEFFRGELIPVEREALEARHKQLLAERNSAVEANRVLSQVKDILSEIDTVARPNHGWVEDIAPNLVDKKNVLKDGTYGFNDFERNLQHFFGKYFDIAKEKILKPLYDSKKAYADYVTEYSDRIYNEVVKELGIKKGSKESKAVQWLGEGERPQDKKLRKKEWTLTDIEYEPYTYEMCVEEFGAERAADIQMAVDVFRECYDEMLDDINRTRAMLYPNNPDKLIPKRKDYFRHFQEMNNSLPGLWATLKNNIGISPELVGVSEETKPKSKWQSMAQMRTGKATKYDAVGGFLDYLPQAAYMTHIDPNIVNIRSLAYDLAMAKAKQGANGNPDANSFIRYLQNYANKLAGKTVSHLDRAVHDSTVGRSLTAAVGWFNNRAKANAVLGNFSSMLSQFANILNIIGSIKNEADVFAGAWDACLGLFGKGDVRDNYEESGFLKERFIGKKLDRFERYGITRLAADALGIADEIGTRITWCAAYREAQRLGVDDMVGYADSLTRKCVAGRGIGEVPLNFESTIAKLFLPFRLEVNNNINVYRDVLFDNTNKKGKHTKAYATRKILELFVASAILNAVMAALKSDEFNPLEDLFDADEEGEDRDVLERLRDLGVDYADGIGDGVVFDPIAAIASGVHQGLTEDKDAGAWKKAGLAMLRPLQNVTGDYLSNDPLAATAIGAMGVDNDAISKLFNDSLYVSPGTGAPVFSSLAKSIGYATDGKWASAGAEALKTFALPFGGSQVDKSVRGIFEAATGASTTERPYERMISDKDGVLKYLIEPNAENWAKSVLFGPTAFSGASDAFYNSDGKKLTEEETKEVLKLPDYDARKTLFDELIAGKEYRDKDEKQKQMDEAANAYKESVKGDSIVYQMYQDGYKNASPFLQVYLDMSMTVDGTKYEVKLTADEGTAANEALTDVLSERFRELDGSERFRALPKEERESHIDKIRDLEHKHIKTEFLHDKGVIPDDLYVEMTFDYEKSRANQDRKLFVDDAQSFIESNAQVSAEQYLTYVGEGRATDEVVRQVRKYTEYASHRAPTDVDVELMELSNRLQVENPKRYDLNVYGNASGLINFTKKGVEYYIDMPAEHTYELMAMTDDACRAELSKLFKTKGYTDATDGEKADMISKVKSKVRAGIKDKLKAKYKSVKVDDFDKILAMGGTK